MKNRTNFTKNFTPILLLPIIYAIFKCVAPLFIEIKIFSTIIEPLTLSIIATCFIYYTRNRHGYFTQKKENLKLLIIFALIYIVFNVILGFVFSFAYNPYSTKPIILLNNIWQIIIPIASIEYIRSAVINQNSRSPQFVIFFTIIFIILELNIYNFIGNISNFENFFKYTSSTLLPTIFTNALFSYITIQTGFLPIMVYRIITQIALITIPIVPNLDWYTLGIRELLFITIIFFTFNHYNKHNQEYITIRSNKTKQFISFIPALIFVVFLTLFMTGTLKYVPISILSNSMVPIFERGDVVLYEKNTKENIKTLEKGDIIVYNKNGQVVVHRIINKFKDAEELFFITKGDANNSQDKDPVSETSVLGIYKTSIKKLGWPSIWLREIFVKNEVPEIETK